MLLISSKFGDNGADGICNYAEEDGANDGEEDEKK